MELDYEFINTQLHIGERCKKWEIKQKINKIVVRKRSEEEDCDDDDDYEK